jgi:hypothetical protein
MSACSSVQQWITQKISMPILTFTKEAKEVCKEVKEKIEEEVERPVEEWLNQQEKRCSEQPWWNPLRWICAIVTIVVKVVTWVVTTVVKWVVTIVCQVVTIVVATVIGFFIAIVKWLVTFPVCLLTEPGAALGTFRDLWLDLLGTAEKGVKLIDVLLEDADGILVDVGHLIDTIGHSLGPVGVFIAGLIKWVINVLRGAINIIRGIVDHLIDIAIGILRLDWCRISAGVLGIGLDVIRIILLLPRVVFGFTGGIRDAYNQEQVETIVEESLQRTFAGEPEQLAAASKKLRLGGRPFGVPITVRARRCFVSSRSRTVDLRELNASGAIDLSAAVGFWTACRGHGFTDRFRWEAVYAGTDLTVSWGDVKRYLEKGPDAVPEFRVYAMTADVLRRDLRLAKLKAAQIGVALGWTIEDLELVSVEEVPMPDSDAANDELMERVGRAKGADNLCEPPAIAVFGYANPKRNGRTSWARPKPTEAHPEGDVHPSGVSFKDRLPEWLYQWVLIHELGHYFGLDHAGHDGVDNIMYTADPEAGLEQVTLSTVAEYVLMTGESNFTLQDARVVWEWIPENARPCLT